MTDYTKLAKEYMAERMPPDATQAEYQWFRNGALTFARHLNERASREKCACQRKPWGTPVGEPAIHTPTKCWTVEMPTKPSECCKECLYWQGSITTCHDANCPCHRKEEKPVYPGCWCDNKEPHDNNGHYSGSYAYHNPSKALKDKINSLVRYVKELERKMNT